MNFVPKDQIVLLAGLDSDATRARVWALPELRQSVQRLAAAGLLEGGDDARKHEFVPHALSEPAGVAAARALRHITLDDLLGEHLPDRI